MTGKFQDRAFLGFYTEKAVKAELERIARAQKRSISDILRELVTEYIRTHPAPPEPVEQTETPAP